MFQVLPNDIDLLNPPPELEKKKHKLKRLVQSPNSFFMVSIYVIHNFISTYIYVCVCFSLYDIIVYVFSRRM